VKVDLSQLHSQVDELCSQHPGLDAPNAFLAWFARAYLVDNDDDAVASVRGGPHDRGVDAIFFDQDLHAIYLLQGKYRRSVGHSENRAEVLALASLAPTLLADDPAPFRAFVNNTPANLRPTLETIRKRVRNQGWNLHLYFVTTGRVTEYVRRDAEAKVSEVGDEVVFQCFDHEDIERILNDYIDGVAPSIPRLILPIHGREVFQRPDVNLGIESWVFSMLTKDVGGLFTQAGRRLFARNIRGYLGDKEINREIRHTLQKDSVHFWYFNNGVTIVCNAARRTTTGARDVLVIENPQIINGQQSTRTMAVAGNGRAAVLVRVIAVRRDSTKATANYNRLINEIVKATNWQNPIGPADLRSNDDVQVWLERSLRRLDYQYLRKRETYGEALERIGNRPMYQIKMKDLARQLAACFVDPGYSREGEHALFSKDIYSRLFSEKISVWKYLVVDLFGDFVATNSRGNSDRTATKWFALRIMWDQLHARPLTVPRARALVEALQMRAHARSPQGKLQSVVATLAQLSLLSGIEYYRSKRRSNKDLIDDFFRRMHLVDGFATFVKSSSCKRRHSFRRAVTTMHALLDESMAEN
jgi:hypothetical protein